MWSSKIDELGAFDPRFMFSFEAVLVHHLHVKWFKLIYNQ
jgi:hypothetical protein